MCRDGAQQCCAPTQSSLTEKTKGAADAAPFVVVARSEREIAAQWRSLATRQDHAANRGVIETFLRYARQQGYISRELRIDELFVPETLDF